MVQINVTEELRDVIKEEVERLVSEIEEKYKGIADELKNLKEQQNLRNENMNLRIEKLNESIDLKFYQLKENFSNKYEESVKSLNESIQKIQEGKTADCDETKSPALNNPQSDCESLNSNSGGTVAVLKSSLKNFQKNQNEILKKAKTFEAEINGLKSEYQKIEEKLKDELNSLKKSIEAIKGNLSRNEAKTSSTDLKTSPVKIPMLDLFTLNDLRQVMLSNHNEKWIEDFLKLFPDGMCFSMRCSEKYLICPRIPYSYIKESHTRTPQPLSRPEKISTIEGEITVTSRSRIWIDYNFFCKLVPDKLLQNYAVILGFDFLYNRNTKIDGTQLKVGGIISPFNLYSCHDE